MVKFNDSFYEPEIRCDFRVGSKRKKVWAREIEIIDIFDGICKKHGLRYWATHGTLLGAIRHQGFIPWDDDVDLVMPREDYEAARRIMAEELPDPFEWQDLYTNLAKCSPEQITEAHTLPFAKIRNRMTTAIEPPVMPSLINQGIWIDIFPLDDGLDDEGLTPHMFEIEKELYAAVFGDASIKEYLVSEEFNPALSREDLKGIISLHLIEKFRMYEEIVSSFKGSSSKYSIKHFEILGWWGCFDKSFFDETVLKPFETIMLPVPARYHELLVELYGEDYNTPIMDHVHSAIFDPDTSYIDYFKNPSAYAGKVSDELDD